MNSTPTTTTPKKEFLQRELEALRDRIYWEMHDWHQWKRQKSDLPPTPDYDKCVKSFGPLMGLSKERHDADIRSMMEDRKYQSVESLREKEERYKRWRNERLKRYVSECPSDATTESNTPSLSKDSNSTTELNKANTVLLAIAAFVLHVLNAISGTKSR